MAPPPIMVTCLGTARVSVAADRGVTATQKIRKSRQDPRLFRSLVAEKNISLAIPFGILGTRGRDILWVAYEVKIERGRAQWRQVKHLKKN